MGGIMCETCFLPLPPMHCLSHLPRNVRINLNKVFFFCQSCQVIIAKPRYLKHLQSARCNSKKNELTPGSFEFEHCRLCDVYIEKSGLKTHENNIKHKYYEELEKSKNKK